MLDSMNDNEWRLVRLERLGLKEDPFKLSADPRYLYLGPEHWPFIVRHRVSSPDGATGTDQRDMGMGKSSLARRLYDVYASEETLIFATFTRLPLNPRWCRRQISQPWEFHPNAPFSVKWKGLRNSWPTPTPPTTTSSSFWMTPN